MSSPDRFVRSDRLLDPRDFRRVSRRGRRTASNYFVLLRAPRRDTSSSSRSRPGQLGPPERPRLGITVSRKVGNAVARNYIKRSVREWFRGVRNSIDVCDLVVIARRDAANLRGAQFEGALSSLLANGSRQGS